MSVRLKDGTGGGFEAEVNSKNELAVAARTIPRSAIVSERDGLTFSWVSSYSAAAGQETLPAYHCTCFRRLPTESGTDREAIRPARGCEP